jgi:hypothetical protein
VSTWPAAEYVQRYDGFEFLLLPETETTPTAIAIEVLSPLDYDSARAAIRRFLSAFAWVHGCSADDDFGIGSAFPGGVGKDKGPVRCSNPSFHIEYLPSTTDPKTKLCLALYREAFGLSNYAYRFLGFFKIINVLFAGGREQKAWINAALPKLTGRDAMERITELRKTQADLGHYLFESGRCAVAHAYAEPIVDPDDPADTQRLFSDLPIVKALAEHLIEVDLGIKSSDTVRREHLYELRGFRDLFGAETNRKLKAKENVDLEALPMLPDLTFQVRHHAPYSAFQRMAGKVVGTKDGIVGVLYTAPSGRVRAYVELDFPEERLRFDPKQSIETSDDGSADAMNDALDAHRLFRDVILNGVVEVWIEDSDQPFAQAQPYIPVNMRYDGAAWRASHEAMSRELLVRSGSPAAPSVPPPAAAQ